MSHEHRDKTKHVGCELDVSFFYKNECAFLVLGDRIPKRKSVLSLVFAQLYDSLVEIQNSINKKLPTRCLSKISYEQMQIWQKCYQCYIRFKPDQTTI